MTIMPPLRSAALGMALLVSASALALAQTAGTPASPTPSAKTANPAAGAALARVEARIKQLHAQLQITAAEEPQWAQFAETMRANAREMDEAATQRAEKLSSMNAV